MSERAQPHRCQQAATAATSPASASISITSPAWDSPSCGPRRCWETTSLSISYHGYAITDLYRKPIRASAATRITARLVARGARKRGIGLIMDVVLNRVGSRHWWMADPPTADWFNHASQYTGNQRSSHHRAGPACGTATGQGAVRRRLVGAGRQCPISTSAIRTWRGLPDPEHAVVDRVRRTLRHPRGHLSAMPTRDFLSAWSGAVAQDDPGFRDGRRGVERENPAIVAHWQRGKVNHRRPRAAYAEHDGFSAATIALRTALRQPEGWGGGWLGLYEMLANDFLYPDPGRLVVFAENHDSRRACLRTSMASVGTCSRWRSPTSRTMRGTPQFYYGSEVLLQGPARTQDDGELARRHAGRLGRRCRRMPSRARACPRRQNAMRSVTCVHSVQLAQAQSAGRAQRQAAALRAGRWRLRVFPLRRRAERSW